MNSSEQTKELETMPVYRLLLKFAIPAMTGTFVNSMYNIVDRMFLGHYIGEMGIAATTVVMPMMMIVMAVGMLIAFGSNSQMSIKLGEKNYEEAEKLLGQGWFMFVVSALLITVFSIWKMDPLLELFGASDQVLPYARGYAIIIMLGTLANEISFGANNFVRGEGNPRFAMVTMIIGGIVNIVMDYVFIVEMGWGMEGAAWATVIGYSCSALWVFSYYFRGKSVVKLKLKNFKLHSKLVGKVMIMGSPNFIMNLIASVQASVFNNQLLKFGGDVAVSTMGVIMSFNFFWLMFVIGMSQGMQPIVGYNYGAKKFDRVKRALYLSFAAVTVMCTFLFVVVQIFPEYVFKMFISDEASGIMKMGPQAIKDVFVLLPVVGYMIICANYFQFTGKPMVSLSLTLLRQVVFLLPLLLVLPSYIGLRGVWYTLPLSDFGALLVTLIFYIRELKSLRILIEEQRKNEAISANKIVDMSPALS